MTIYKQQSWNEFSQVLEDLILSEKPKLVHYIDYFLKQGGKYLDLKKRIEDKTLECNHGGYQFPRNMFAANGNPAERSFLGHIAARVINENLVVRIGDNLIDQTVINLSINKKMEKNELFKKMCAQNCYIRIETFKGDRRTDEAVSDKMDREQKIGTDYLPAKKEVEFAYHQIAIPYEELNIDLLLDQINKNMKKEKKIPKKDWRLVTENMIFSLYGISKDNRD